MANDSEENRNQIRDRVIAIRETLLLFERACQEINEHCTIKYAPVLEFKDKSKYPLDFQIFMEEIGELEIGTNGYLCINITKPIPPLDVNIDEDYWAGCDGFDGDAWPPEKEYNGFLPQYIQLFGSDVDGQTYGFYTQQNPYLLTSVWVETNGADFLDWFVEHVNYHIESSYWTDRDIRFRLK